MKFSEMNARQKKAYKNVYYAARDLIGGLENTISDNPEGSEERTKATAYLSDHDALVAAIYDMSITDIYDEGAVYFGKEAEAHMKDIRFCGKDWITERIERQVVNLGY